MSDIPPSMYTFHVSDNSGPSEPRGHNKYGCWPCRFRKKGCKPGSAGPEGPCEACSTFNMICCGRSLDRPSGPELATQLRALMTAWIRNTANRGPSISPLDLALVISSLSLAVNSSDSDQRPDDTTTSPLFLPEETHNSHQVAHTAGPAPSYNQTSTIYPLDTGTLSNDTQFGFYNPNHNHYQPAPRLTGGSEDHFPSTSSFPSSFYYDQNVPTSSSAGSYHPFGSLEGRSAEIFVSREQLVLTAPHAPDNRTGLPRGSYQARR